MAVRYRVDVSPEFGSWWRWHLCARPCARARLHPACACRNRHIFRRRVAMLRPRNPNCPFPSRISLLHWSGNCGKKHAAWIRLSPWTFLSRHTPRTSSGPVTFCKSSFGIIPSWRLHLGLNLPPQRVHPMLPQDSLSIRMGRCSSPTQVGCMWAAYGLRRSRHNWCTRLAVRFAILRLRCASLRFDLGRYTSRARSTLPGLNQSTIFR